uniref:Uncharacterized protein n=1 Tax=Lepeophtheirus salmonis TaxID=72036 RepID=A0A0K2T3I6_LEPSM
MILLFFNSLSISFPQITYVIDTKKMFICIISTKKKHTRTDNFFLKDVRRKNPSTTTFSYFL